MKMLYSAYNREGNAVSDVIEASSISEAQEMLRAKGLYVSQITEQTTNSIISRSFSLFLFSFLALGLGLALGGGAFLGKDKA